MTVKELSEMLYTIEGQNDEITFEELKVKMMEYEKELKRMKRNFSSDYLSFRTEEEIYNYRVMNGGIIDDKRINSETGMIEVKIINLNTRKYTPITTWETYKNLSENAKKVINCVKYDEDDKEKDKATVCIKVGKPFVDDEKKEIVMTEKLYNEIFNFVRHSPAIGYSRYNGEDGIEEIEIWLPIDRGIRLK